MNSCGMFAIVGWIGLSAMVNTAPAFAGASPGSTLDRGVSADAAAPTPSQDEDVVLVHARRLIVRPGEVLEDTAILVRGGKIAAVGQDLAKPEGAREISGEFVCAGFVDAWGALGLSPDSLLDGSTSAATRSLDGLDTYGNAHLRIEALRRGVTCVRLQAGNLSRVGGLGLVARIAPNLSNADAVVHPSCDVSMTVGLSSNASGQFGGDQGEVSLSFGSKAMDPFERMADIDRLIASLESGRTYLQSKIEYKHELEAWQKTVSEKETELDKDFKKAKKERDKEQKDAQEKSKEFKEKKYKEDKKPQPPRYDEDSEVMARVSNGEMPLIVQAHRAAEIRALLRGTEGFDRLRLILAGATESMACSKQLAERHIPVLVWPALRGRGAPDEYEGSDLALAAMLSRDGVKVLLGTGGSNPGASRDLALLAEMTIGSGFDRDKAFESLTIGAARALDVADRLGSVERGKDAELLVLDGEPLASATRVRYVISAGRVVLTPED